MTFTAAEEGVYLGDVGDADFESLGEIVLDTKNEVSEQFEERWILYPFAECPASELDPDAEIGTAHSVPEGSGLYPGDERPECEMVTDDETVEVWAKR